MDAIKIVIAGGNGFIGSYLAKGFEEVGKTVILINRRIDQNLSYHQVLWSNRNQIAEACSGAQVVINLAGKSVDCRYTDKNKEEIMLSRTETTQMLGEIISAASNPPEVWINSSTATIYRNSMDCAMTETSGELGHGFSVEVAKAWEHSFTSFKLSHTRQIILRTAIVLGKDGGALKPLNALTKLGLGGKQGSGKQMVSWIEMEDVYRAISFLIKHKSSGIYNLSAPYPINNQHFMREIRKANRISFGLPTPTWLLKIGAFFIRTEAELLLKSRWVIPQRLLDAGFNFKYPTIEDALIAQSFQTTKSE
ncbi:MAG: hypothetical protein ACI8ZN_002268 [Bacteroidia bacterium]|jgi:uncharacterized protein (TIGR01777 family)